VRRSVCTLARVRLNSGNDTERASAKCGPGSAEVRVFAWAGTNDSGVAGRAFVDILSLEQTLRRMFQRAKSRFCGPRLLYH